MTNSFNQMLAHLTGGRRYCFVVMTYHEDYAFFEGIRRIVVEETGVECIRADEIPASGEDRRPKIHAAIQSSAFVIADVSFERPNIYYEVGYAAAVHKPILLLAKAGATLASNLEGVEIICYETGTKDGWTRFEQDLRKHLAVHKESNVSLLRSMVIPQSPRPSYILVNPRKPPKGGPAELQPRQLKTWGDYLGVVGILSAFASVYGEHVPPELVSAAHAADEITDADASYYVIGSGRSNRFTCWAMDAIQRGRPPCWDFLPRRTADSPEDPDACYRFLHSEDFTSEGLEKARASKRGSEDYGIILRGPHPGRSNRMLMVLAGVHSLGTGAASLAATRSDLVRRIGEVLGGRTILDTRDQSIWVLVKGTTGKDRHLAPEDVEIINAGIFPQP